MLPDFSIINSLIIKRGIIVQMEQIILVLFFLLALLSIASRIKNIIKIVRAFLLKDTFGEVILKVKEHGRINYIIIVFCCFLGIAAYTFLEILRYSFVSQWNKNHLIDILVASSVIVVLLDLIKEAIKKLKQTFVGIEFRELGIITGSVYEWDCIESYSWEKTERSSWDKESNFFMLKLIVNNKKRNKEEILEIREKDKADIDRVLNERISYKFIPS